MINIAEKLKNAPKETKLYSSMYGEVYFDKICDSGAIKVTSKYQQIGCYFDKYGRYNEAGECLLFPSKDQRSWDTFILGNKYNFKPFDKVVVRETYGAKWSVNFFSHYEYGTDYPYRCLNDVYFCCLPYNKETAKLIGTTDDYE